MRCERHHIVHYGQCPTCLAEAVAQLGTYSNNIATQQASMGQQYLNRMDASARQATAGLGAPAEQAKGARGPAPPSLTERVGIAKVNGEWVDTKSPRTIAEARAAAEATQFLDKHGTEVRVGDRYRRDDGQVFEALHSYFVGGNPFATDTVLSRADGTPVLRYADGNDVRPGDEAMNSLGERVGVKPDFVPTPQNVRDGAYSRCTLIRRAEVQSDQTTEWYVKDYPGNVSKAHKLQFSKDATEASEAIDRFADWLNQPTLSQRFEAFRERISYALLHNEAHAVEAIYDVHDGKPFVMLGFQGIQTTILADGRDVECLDDWLNYCEQTIGRDVLRGKLKLKTLSDGSGKR